MALVMHSTPGDSPRRSPRIRVRRQTNLSRPSCVRTHTQTAVSRPVLARSTHPSNLPPDALLVLASKHAAPKSGLRSSLSHSQSQREPHNARTRASSSSSTAASSSRTKSPSKKKAAVRLPDLSPSLPVVAGTKRKRSHSRPVPAYELVSARPEADEEAQTPRQLRYAKRQRLLVARSGTDAPAASAGCSRTLVNDPSQRGDASSIRKVDERAGSRERVLHRASTEGRLLSPPPSIPPPSYTQPSAVSSDDVPDTPSSDGWEPPERPPTPIPAPASPVSEKAVPTTDVPPVNVPPKPEPVAHSIEVDDSEDVEGPTITPIRRLPLPPRERRPETTDQSLWKVACQERVEHLKEVYRDVFEAVLRAEALTAQRSSEEAPESTATPPTEPSVQAQTQREFKLYTPSTCTAARVDADGDTDMDGDVGYSSDWDSDEDEEDEDDDLLMEDLDGTLPTYDEVVALDGAGSGKLPPLSAIPVYALEAVPEPTGRNGVPFMGRGTPVDRQRRADWASSSPVRPLSRFSYREAQLPSHGWTANPPSSVPNVDYFAPAPQMAYSSGMQMDVSTGTGMGGVYDSSPSLPMTMPMPMDVQMPAPAQFGMPTMEVEMEMGMGMEMAYAQPDCMPWLDPTLRSESASPSPVPASPPPPTTTMTTIVPPSVPAIPSAPPPYPAHAIAAMSDFSAPPTIPVPPSTPPPAEFPMLCAQDGVSSTSASTPGSGSGLGSPSPTGCAWHATFLQCLQSSGCAPFFASQPSPSPAPAPPAPVPAPVLAPAPMEATAGRLFPDQELAQFVRSHLVPGSVALRGALG